MRGGVLTRVSAERSPVRVGRSQWYSICGLLVQSELPLPFPTLPDGTDRSPAWTIMLGDPAERPAIPQLAWPDGYAADDDAPADPNEAIFRWLRDADGTWLWVPGVAAVRVSNDAQQVRVLPDPRADEHLLGLLAGGPLATFVMRELGHALLHASAVATPVGAVAFMGPKGRGKSTMAAAFLKDGMPLLTDDILLLHVRGNRVYGVPGPGAMKIWGPTAEHTLGLEPSALPDLAPTVDKKLLRIEGHFKAVSDPQPIVGLYLLDRYEPTGSASVSGSPRVTSQLLHGPQALGVLLSHSQGSVQSSAAVSSSLPPLARLVSQAPVRVLHYPSSFQDQASVCRYILAEVSGG